MTSRYSLLLVFNYANTASKSTTPSPLLGMENDILRAYHLSNRCYGISRSNITIITDIQSKSTPYPWEKHKEGPVIIKLQYPSINLIVETIIKTMNKIRKLEAEKNTQAEIFIYYSGHGMLHSSPIKNYTNSSIPSLILVDSLGKERRYLTSRELTNLFYGLYQSDELGIVEVPVLIRKMTNSFNTNLITYEKTSILVDTQNEGIIRNKDINFLFIYDACHSAGLSGLKFRYQKNNSFEENFVDILNVPLSAGISATNDRQEAPSCIEGSPFTSQIYDMFEKNVWNNQIIKVTNLYDKIYQYLHPILRKKCYPTVDISEPNLDIQIPMTGISTIM